MGIGALGRGWHEQMVAQGSGMRGQGLQSASRVAVGVLLLHLAFEYLRLHDIIPILGSLKIQTVIFGAMLLLVIAEAGKGGLRLTRQSRLFLGFFALATFTILTATNNYYAYRFAYNLMLLLIGYFAITHILRNERDLNRFLSLLVGIHIYLGLKVILGYDPRGFSARGYQTGFEAGSSFLGDENDVALAMIVSLPLAIHLFRQSHSLPGRLFWGVGSVVIFLSIVFTFSRGGFIGLAAMVLYWVWTSKNKVRAISALVLAGGILIAVAPERYWERMETIKETDSGTAQLRRNYWTAARRMFYDSPIWGVGGNNFGVLLPEYALEFPEEKRGTRWGKASHSMYFDLLAQFGLLGVFLVGSVIVLNFRDMRNVIVLGRQGHCLESVAQLAESLRVSWVGFLVPAAFLSVLTYPHLYYLTGIIVVVRKLAFAEAAELDVDIGPIGVPEPAK